MITSPSDSWYVLPPGHLLRFTYVKYSSFIQEFDSLCELYNFKYTLIEEPEDKPFFILETDNQVALEKIVKRSILINAYYELWISANTYEEYYKQIRNYNEINNEFYKMCSFCINVDTYGKKVNHAYKIDKIEELDFLPWDGPIKLHDRDAQFYHFEYFGNDRNVVPDLPYEIHFGKWIADGGRTDSSRFALKHRKFIANTSMEHNLAFLMANMAKLDDGDLVYDPFVGSGSLLVSAAYFGAYCFGTDIDYLLLHGLAKNTRYGKRIRDDGESVLGNFMQYSVENRYVDVFSGDSSLPNIRENFHFDAVITDPPYGRRESRERIGSKKSYVIPDELVAAHIPSKLEYEIDDIYKDLFEFSLSNLKIGGRLVFWAPYSRPTNEEDSKRMQTVQVPAMSFFKQNHDSGLEDELRNRFCHEAFKFVGFVEQGLGLRYSRNLIVLERIK